MFADFLPFLSRHSFVHSTPGGLGEGGENGGNGSEGGAGDGGWFWHSLKPVDRVPSPLLENESSQAVEPM